MKLNIEAFKKLIDDTNRWSYEFGRSNNKECCYLKLDDHIFDVIPIEGHYSFNPESALYYFFTTNDELEAIRDLEWNLISILSKNKNSADIDEALEFIKTPTIRQLVEYHEFDDNTCKYNCLLSFNNCNDDYNDPIYRVVGIKVFGDHVAKKYTIKYKCVNNSYIISDAGKEAPFTYLGQYSFDTYTFLAIINGTKVALLLNGLPPKGSHSQGKIIVNVYER